MLSGIAYRVFSSLTYPFSPQSKHLSAQRTLSFPDFTATNGGIFDKEILAIFKEVGRGKVLFNNYFFNHIKRKRFMFGFFFGFLPSPSRREADRVSNWALKHRFVYSHIYV